MAVSLSRYDPSLAYKNQKSFDCGNKVINDFVARSLKQQTLREVAVGYVLTDETAFVGFCTLMAASIGRDELAAISPPSLPQNVPVTKLPMLGVSVAYQGQGYGRQLLRHAIRVMVASAESIGTCGLYLDADDGAFDFYGKHGFVALKARQSPEPTPMFLPVKTARQALEGQAQPIGSNISNPAS